MPKIPMFEDKIEITARSPGTLVDTRSFGMIEQTLAKTDDKLMEFGAAMTKVGLDLKARIDQAQQVMDLGKATGESLERLYKAREEAKRDPDPGIWEGKFKEEAQKIHGEITSRLTDREVRTKFQTHWNTAYPHVWHEVFAAGRDQKIKNFKADIEAQLPKLLDLYGRSANDLERSRVKGSFFGLLDGGTSAGFLRPDESVKLKTAFVEHALVGQVQRDIVTNPWQAEARLAEPDKYYKGLEPQAALQLTGTARAEVHRRQETNAVELDKAFDAGQLSLGALQEMRDSRAINLGTFRFYEGLLKGAQGVGGGGGRRGQKTDLNIFVPMLQAAQEGILNEDKVYQTLAAGGITKADAKGLLATNSARARGEELKDQAYAKNQHYLAGTHELENRLKPLDKLQDLKAIGGVKGPSPVYEATHQFRLWAEEAQKRPGEFTGPKINDKVQEIIQGYEKLHLQKSQKGAAPDMDPYPGHSAPSYIPGLGKSTPTPKIKLTPTGEPAPYGGGGEADKPGWLKIPNKIPPPGTAGVKESQKVKW